MTRAQLRLDVGDGIAEALDRVQIVRGQGIGFRFAHAGVHGEKSATPRPESSREAILCARSGRGVTW